MQVFQTIGEPPSSGSTIFATIGCTKKSRNALTNSVDVKSGTTADVRVSASASDTGFRPSSKRSADDLGCVHAHPRCAGRKCKHYSRNMGDF